MFFVISQSDYNNNHFIIINEQKSLIGTLVETLKDQNYRLK